MACDLSSAACFAAASPPNIENDIDRFPYSSLVRSAFNGSAGRCEVRACGAMMLRSQCLSLVASAKIVRAFGTLERISEYASDESYGGIHRIGCATGAAFSSIARQMGPKSSKFNEICRAFNAS
jgi:hypothetical protein